ncbi:MAG TPA: alpha/beta fold hydrolase [Gaiellaceae bacterium]
MREYSAASLFVREWGNQGAPAVLYWDGLGGTGLHANEIAPILVEEHGLRVIAPDAPGHGRSPSFPPDAYLPSRLAELAVTLLSELRVERVAFIGFSWGAQVGCYFAAQFPERASALVLVEGGYFEPPEPGTLEACVEQAREEVEEDSFESWDAYFAYERESLRRWTPALEEAHREVMREQDGRVIPILDAEGLGAIIHGNRREPAPAAYPAIAASGVPVLLVTYRVSDPVERFRSALPEARVELIEDGIHDLVSFAPREVAELAGSVVQPPP